MRVFLHTFGCKANQYDTEAVRQALEDSGNLVVDDPHQADAAVINSCTVTSTAEAKMRGLVRRIARSRPGTRTVVMGCAAAVDDGTIAALPGVAKVVPGGDASGVLDGLGIPERDRSSVLRSFARGGRGWLKIQDGCDEHCTFCATTLARGANRSRPIDEIIAEARALAESHAELVLTGIHIGTYGADTGTTLGELAARLVREVPQVRFRLSSVEATEVDDLLAELMAGAPRHLAPHLHAPLQSGSDRVLKRMGRHWYTSARYRERVEQLASRIPHFGLGADVMVGFPGETLEDHRATVNLVRDLPFTYLHVFPYSERPGTAAPRLGRPVAGRVAAERSAELREIAAVKTETTLRARHGSEADLVVSGRAGGKYELITGDYLTAGMPADAALPARFDTTVRWADGALQADPLRVAPAARATADAFAIEAAHA